MDPPPVRPARALALPRSVAALIGTNPRVIADEVWAKLLWAGLNLEPERSARPTPRHLLPDGADPRGHADLAVLRAAQRRDHPAAGRLHPLAARRRARSPATPPRSSPTTPSACSTCPVHKTGTAFTKPVDPLRRPGHRGLAGAAPGAAETMLDRKTGEQVDMLFSVRAQPVAKDYINRTIIPALCAKAGVPTADVRGNITSHRARSTIASQLYNAKEPMTLFELQAWLGHRTPHTTQHYAKITPNTLSKAYTDAGYFARNVRTIEVLLDRDAVTSGAAAAGEPWQHYDLGHGWCTYSFFEQCPHRMACARCDFYTPKDSTKGPTARGQGQPAAHARHHPAHRRRTRRRRRRTRRSRSAARTARRRPHSRRAHPARDRQSPRPRPHCRSSKSTGANADESPKSDSTESAGMSPTRNCAAGSDGHSTRARACTRSVAIYFSPTRAIFAAATSPTRSTRHSASRW